MSALSRYVVKQRLANLLKEAQAFQSPAQKLTAAPVPAVPAPQPPAVTKGVVDAGAPSLVPPPPGKGVPAAMTPQTTKTRY